MKKERQKKLLDESERSQSNAGKADEIRARRAAEERERRMREKERDDAIKKKKDITELVNDGYYPLLCDGCYYIRMD